MSAFLRSLVRSEGKSCEGKLKFPREDSAQNAANEMMEKKRKKGLEDVFEHYHCGFCEGYHIGHRTNFNWIPATHQHHRLMINHYGCDTCGFDWFTSTVFSTRILTHFPGVQNEAEQCVLCPRCKNSGAVAQIVWKGRKWANLEAISPDCTDTLKAIWNSDVSVDKCPDL